MNWRRVDLLVAAAAGIGIIGLAWLGPLMVDQLVFFSDQEQTRQAKESREAMLPAASLVLASAIGLAIGDRRWHALLVALPAIVAVPLAVFLPTAAYQLLAYGLLVPIALGAALSAVFPLPRSLPIAIQLVALVLIIVMGIIGTSLLAIIALLALVVWWRLPVMGRRSPAPPRG